MIDPHADSALLDALAVNPERDMATSFYDLTDSESSLSQLVDRAANGEEIILAKAGKPLARLIPLARTRSQPREPGGWEGRARISQDFDSPLPSEIQTAFEGPQNATSRLAASITDWRLSRERPELTLSITTRQTMGTPPTAPSPAPPLRPS